MNHENVDNCWFTDHGVVFTVLLMKSLKIPSFLINWGCSFLRQVTVHCYAIGYLGTFDANVSSFLGQEFTFYPKQHDGAGH